VNQREVEAIVIVCGIVLLMVVLWLLFTAPEFE
jgi:hypothetical protein